MKKLNVRWQAIGLVAGILIVIAAAVFLIIARATPSEPAQTAAGVSTTVTTVANGAPGGTSTASAPPTQSDASGTQNVPPPPGSTITIHLLTPISNNVWTIGKANPIAWDNAADITGEIDLVNAVTKQFIGVILAETGPKQTSYTWNADQVYLGRYSADERAVVPGTYSIRIHFDGNGLGDLVSGPFTISK
jgi:hypothetical protein